MVSLRFVLFWSNGAQNQALSPALMALLSRLRIHTLARTVCLG
jgi:hypothetical protein